jgi:hypothetical protein
MRRSAHEDLLYARGTAWRLDLEAAHAETEELRGQRDAALAYTDALKDELGKAIGLQVGRPSPEKRIGAVSFPVIVSSFAVQELSKRMDEHVLADVIADQIAKRIALLLDRAHA